MSTTHSEPDKGTDDAVLPPNWSRVETSEVARFERTDGAIVRVRTDFPTRSADRFNRGERVDATGTVRVLFHADGVPGDHREIYSSGTEADGVDAAIAFTRGRCPEHDRELSTDATGCIHCPECTGTER